MKQSWLKILWDCSALKGIIDFFNHDDSASCVSNTGAAYLASLPDNSITINLDDMETKILESPFEFWVDIKNNTPHKEECLLFATDYNKEKNPNLEVEFSQPDIMIPNKEITINSFTFESTLIEQIDSPMFYDKYEKNSISSNAIFLRNYTSAFQSFPQPLLIDYHFTLSGEYGIRIYVLGHSSIRMYFRQIPFNIMDYDPRNGYFQPDIQKKATTKYEILQTRYQHLIHEK